MKVCVQGLWHLGSVTAACLASVKHDVVGLESDQKVISSLSNGKAPIFEPELDELLLRGIQRGSLKFTTNSAIACKDAKVLWVTFDTPVDDEDIADVDYVIDQIKSTLEHLSKNTLVLISSQLPVGTIARLEKYCVEFLPNKILSFACLPENLRLGNALNVFLSPDRIIVGTRRNEDRSLLKILLSPITDKIEWMSIESAEMTKHSVNAFLATSVTFANEIAAICELVGADAKEVERGLKTESRIGPKAYLTPGGSYAGGTLARDIEFLANISQDQQLLTPLLTSVRISNDAHKKWAQRKLLEHYSDLSGVKIAIWGLTYKVGTDTLRRSLSVELIDWLLKNNAIVQVYDPVVKELSANWFNRVKHCSSAFENLEQIQVLIIGTDWPQFKIDATSLHKYVNKDLLIIDANRHLKDSLGNMKLTYISVGSRIIKLKFNE
jgi:UDPglucose 6-dehydrogenase